MTAEELLQIIRRDIGLRLQQTLSFSLSNHYAANTKGLNEASREIERWIDDMMATNLKPYTDVSGSSEVALLKSKLHDLETRMKVIREMAR